MIMDRHFDNFRYERKFLVDQLDVHQLKAIIRNHPAMFVQTYPPRSVNNFYLDSKGMEDYLDNVSGVGNRRKVRIRWYGELFGQIENAILEFKVKRGLAGIKDQYPFGSIVLADSFSDRYFKDVLQEAKLSDSVKAQMKDLNVVLLNRYYRWYFATADGDYRVTIDSKMTFYGVSRLNNHFLNKQVDHNNLVLELKYQVGQERQAAKISSYFPFRVTKSSKYVQGIERVFW